MAFGGETPATRYLDGAGCKSPAARALDGVGASHPLAGGWMFGL